MTLNPLPMIEFMSVDGFSVSAKELCVDLDGLVDATPHNLEGGLNPMWV